MSKTCSKNSKRRFTPRSPPRLKFMSMFPWKSNLEERENSHSEEMKKKWKFKSMKGTWSLIDLTDLSMLNLI
jgi:hypothetical protein